MKTTPIFIIIFIFLAGCETITKPVTQVNKQPKNGLSAQTLALGECGLFLWTTETPRSFLFFQNNKQVNALFYNDGKEQNIIGKDEHPAWNDIIDIDMAYNLAGDKTVRVKGQFADDIENGRRMKQAAITVTKQDGWQEVIPVSGVYACGTK